MFSLISLGVKCTRKENYDVSPCKHTFSSCHVDRYCQVFQKKKIERMKIPATLDETKNVFPGSVYCHFEVKILNLVPLFSHTLSSRFLSSSYLSLKCDKRIFVQWEKASKRWQERFSYGIHKNKIRNPFSRMIWMFLWSNKHVSAT